MIYINNLKPLLTRKTYLDLFLFYNPDNKHCLKKELDEIPYFINKINVELKSSIITDQQLAILYSNIKSILFNIYNAYMGYIEPYHIPQIIRPLIEGVEKYLRNIDPSSEFKFYEHDYLEYLDSYKPLNAFCHANYSNFIHKIDLLNKYCKLTLNYYYKLKNSLIVQKSL